MSEIKAEAIENESLSIAEKEEKVLDNAGMSTKLEDGTYKLDLTQADQPVQEEQPVEQVVEPVQEEQPESEPEVNEPITLIKEEQDAIQVQEQGSLQEEKQTEQKVEEKLQEVKTEYPEGIQNLVDFMNDTGGTLDDYVKLNIDYTNMDDNALLREYYKQTKSHLTDDEISLFSML